MMLDKAAPEPVASPPAGGAMVNVSVVYALPDRYWLRELQLPPDSNVGDAIEASGLIAAVPIRDFSSSHLAVFGKLVTSTTPLREGDRVEILRPLQCDPKEVRRQAAQRQREA